MTTFRKQLILVLILLAVGTAFWKVLVVWGKTKAPALKSISREVPPVRVPLFVVAHVMVPRYIEATGSVHPQYETALAAKILGRVTQVLVAEGESVRKNQLLIRLDTGDLDATVAQAEAGSAASTVKKATAEAASRMEAAISKARIGEAKANLVQSQAALGVALAHLHLVKAGSRDQERKQAAQVVAVAQSDLVLASVTLRRMSDLYKSEAITKQQLDQSQAQYDTARAKHELAVQSESIAREGSRKEEVLAAKEAVRQAEAGVAVARTALGTAFANSLQIAVRKQEVREAQAQIFQSSAGATLAHVNQGYGSIVAPFDGVVTSRLADPGALVSPSVPLLKIEGGAFQLEVVVPESVLPNIRRGSRVSVRFDALGGKDFTGKIAEIVPQGDTASHTFIIKIRVPMVHALVSGMFGRSRFIIGNEKRLMVPRSAIWSRDGLFYLYTVDKMQIAHLRMVTIGTQEGNRTTILTGLNSGETIVKAGYESLHDGSAVQNRE